MPLMTALKLDGCLRLSLAAYNTYAEVDYFINCLQAILVEQLADGLSNDSEEPTIIETKKNKYANDVVNSSLNDIIDLFTKTKGWDSRHREIMLLGKTLPRLDKCLRDEQTLIAGCESLAWLKAALNEQGEYIFSADSDAKIIRGLLVIVLTAYNNKNAKQIHQFDIENYFTQLGLMQHLSPSRGNGLLAIVDKIKCLAK
jgi:cysteine desulfurase/selenocysteine lyase